ncbi:Inner membrane protein YqiJ [Roseovarius albus]|uniref:Inner membrane protein YqiJ n=1 Tax=Roseovarius albus TaxID=1247867 RepID=A0A1X6YFJ1_9RHOB|nr:OB-fold-containig protein [Roseovarius albus]SLN19082.1 Inner membrane protein YqiJ [Roseovarius albus]
MDLLLEPGLKPFVFFGVLVIGFLLLEVLLMSIGVDTQISGDSDADFDLDVDFDADLDADFDVDTDTELGTDIDFNIDPDIDAEAGVKPRLETSGGFFDLIGLRKLPLTVWLALFSAFFAGIGLSGQTLMSVLTGTVLPAILAALIVLPVALFFTRYCAEAVANWVPRVETTAISERSYGRRKGVITVGSARRDQPAQVRFTDAHGNLHYVMAEPLSDDDTLPEGTEVLILRRRQGDLKLVRIS